MTEVIVYNETRNLGTRQAVEILVDSVHPPGTISEERRSQICELLWRTPAARTTSDHAIAFLNQSASSTESDRVRMSAARTTANRLSYVAKTKENRDAVFYPGHGDDDRRITEELPYARLCQIVDRTTPIGSAGSCFATEIALRLRAGGFNYVVTETPPDGVIRFPARWGLIFNTPSLRQLVEKAYGVRETPRILWETDGQDGETVFKDPFREHVHFTSVEEYEEDYDRHVEAARRALDSCEVFVLTLGVNEVWRLESDGSVLARVPWGVGSSLVRPEVLSVEQNVAELQSMLDTWRSHNPNIRIIVTVSPVPLTATFRGDEQHVITATCQSKSVLRVAADRFAAANDGVDYFPSFETVMYCSGDPWRPDFRHVTRPTVSRVMRLFDTMFVRGPGDAAVRAMERAKQSTAETLEARVTLMVCAGTSVDEEISDIVSSYLTEFTEDDDVCLVVWCLPGSCKDLTELVETNLTSAGLGAESGPNIHILESADPPLTDATAVIALGCHDGRFAARARQAGILALTTDANEWREVHAAAIELAEIEAIIDAIASRADEDLAERLEDLRAEARRYARTKKTGREQIEVVERIDEVTDGLISKHVALAARQAYPPRPGSGAVGPSDVKAVERLLESGFVVLDIATSDLVQAVKDLEAREDADTVTLLGLSEVARIAVEPSLLATVQEALGCSPILLGAELIDAGEPTSAKPGEARIVIPLAAERRLALVFTASLFSKRWRPVRLEDSWKEAAESLKGTFPRVLDIFYD